MEIIKSYTDISQSKILSKILPLKSADMQYISLRHKDDTIEWIPQLGIPSKYDIPCWSLASLLGVLPNYQLQTQDDGIGILCSCKGKFNIVTADNPVDACVAMIEKLHELKML